MSNDRQKILVEKLIEKTANGNIEWQSTVSSDAVQLIFSKSSLKISQVRGNSSIDYYVYLINSNGQVAASFSDVDLDRSEENGDISWFAKMGDLYAAAKRKALRSNEVLNNLIDEIDGIVPF